MKKLLTLLLAAMLGVTCLVGCGNKSEEEQVIIYSNADDEAVEAMKLTLDAMDTKENMFSRALVLQSLAEKCLQKEEISKRILLP